MKKIILSLILMSFAQSSYAGVGTKQAPIQEDGVDHSLYAKCSVIASKVMGPGHQPPGGSHPAALTPAEQAIEKMCRKRFPELFLPRP